MSVRVATKPVVRTPDIAAADETEVKAVKVEDEFAVPYRVKLSPPWNTYWAEVNGLLGRDPQLHVQPLEESENGYALKILVDDQDKYIALSQILPKQKVYGNVVLDIILVPADASLSAPLPKDTVEEIIDAYEIALKDTGRMDGKEIVTLPTGGKIGYVITQCGVFQFFNDDLTTLYGWKTETIEDLFKNVFGPYSGDPVIYFSSSIIR